MKVKTLIIGVLLAALLLFFSKDIGGLFASEKGSEGTVGAAQEKKGKASRHSNLSSVTVVAQWSLPEVLNEVSGIAFIGEGRFACVQDEEGIIFIYNTATQKIERQIPFAGAGDYEGITLAGNTAYVVRADGMLYAIKDYTAAQPEVTTYKTPLTTDHNIEGLAFDKKANRLLLVPKDKDLAGRDGKGVYAFDLSTNKLNEQPVFAIATPDGVQGSGKNKAVRPSAIGIHPVTGDYYIVDGPKSRLLRLDGSGNLVSFDDLGGAFAQPEGITFDPGGRIFISNERGKKSAANIMEIKAGKG